MTYDWLEARYDYESEAYHDLREAYDDGPDYDDLPECESCGCEIEDCECMDYDPYERDILRSIGECNPSLATRRF